VFRADRFILICLFGAGLAALARLAELLSRPRAFAEFAVVLRIVPVLSLLAWAYLILRPRP
jgi:hypothetical protein